MSFAVLANSVFGITLIAVLVFLWLSEDVRWVEIYGVSAHRPAELGYVLGALRKAGIRFHIRSLMPLGDTAIGAGMSTTVLVRRSDLGNAQQAMADRHS